MEDTVAEVVEKGSSKELTQQRFLDIMGLDEMAQTPEQTTVRSFYLGPEYLVGVGEAIKDTSSKWDRRERSFDVGVDASSSLVKSDTVIGSEYACGSKAQLRDMMKLLHIKPKALIDFHTHPRNWWLYSPQDIASDRSFPNKGYMFMLGSNSMVSVICQTEASMKVGINPIKKFDEVMSDLKQDHWPTATQEDMRNLEYYWGDSSPEEMQRLATVLEKHGFTYFTWRPEDGTAVTPDKLKEGIVFNRVMPIKEQSVKPT